MRIILSESELKAHIRRMVNEIYDPSEDKDEEQYVILDKNSHKMLHWGTRQDCRDLYDHTATYKNNKDIRVMRATDARKLVNSKADVTDKTTDRNDGHR